jgi:sterol desaturase/sphingolipid hydroxylase (fatty acid hydroxylase superfamily)
MNPFALSFAVMLGLILVEMAHWRWVRRRSVPWADVVFNLGSGHLPMWLLRGVEVACFGWLLGHANLHWVDALPAWAAWAFGFVAWDFCFYWMHRLHHQVPLLWAVHEVHHTGEHFNLSLGVRNSWYSSLTSFLFVWPLAVLGLPLDVFVAVSSFHYTVQLYNHNSWINRSGWLERVMITPSLHRVHHATHPQYLNRNFGGTLLLWDRLFGSFQPECVDLPMHFGVSSAALGSLNPLWANHAGLARRLGVRWPLGREPGRGASAGFIGLGGVLLFLLVIDYVQHQAQWAAGEAAAWAVVLTLGSLALGGVSDGRAWGRWAWLALAVLAAPACLLGFGARDALAPMICASWGGHSLWGAWKFASHRKP